MNAPKLPPPDHPDAPKYWMYEASGARAPVVTKYLNNKPLDSAEVKYFKAYLWQWVKSPVWAPSGLLEAVRLRVAAIETVQDIAAALAAMDELCMDPL